MNNIETYKNKSFNNIKEDYLSLRKLTKEKGTFKGDKMHMKVFGMWLEKEGLNNVPFQEINKYQRG